MARKYTIFQNIDRAFSGDWNADASSPHINSYDMSTADKSILYRTTNKDDYESKKLELQQNAYLKDRWIKANVDLSVSAYSGLNNVKLMYRDADLMDAFPEIGAALDIVTEESTITSDKGMIVNVYSKSDRIKSILEDLFVNRLNIQVTAPMVVRAMCKYGNQFMLLDIDNKLGVKGWKQLPVFNVERIENGVANPYGAIATQYNNTNNIDTSTKFIWVNENNSQIPFRNWQIAHFRLLTNSLYLPYGCLVGDTRIETELGYKEIQNIHIGDKVWTFNLATQQRELSTVTMQMNKGEKDVYYVGTKHHSIEGTSDHKLLIFDKSNKKFKYKEIKDIQTDDLLVTFDGVKNETKKIKIDKSDLKDFEHGKKSLKWWDDYIKYIPEYITEDFAKLFGFMLGDGWVSHSMNVMFALGEYNTLNEEYIKLLEKYSGKKISFLSQKKNSNKKLKYHTAFVTSKMLATILKRMGFLGDCYTKRIPSWVFEANTEIKKSFLKGLIDADGSISIISKDSFGYTIELANEELVKDIKTLVMSLGLKCGNVHKRDRLGVVSKNKDGDSIIVKHYSYYINFCNKELHQVKRITPHIDSIKLEKIKNVKHIGQKETFDITVDNDNSNFFANGIVTHNCSYLNGARRHWRMLSLMEDLMLIYRLERSIERRVYKIYVGAIDDADVQAYVENIANNFKRTPIIDPMTGQLDLRKNILPVHKDTPIPLLDGRTITIENLAKEFENGKENYVYSVQDKTLKIVPGEVVWCGKNYTAEKLIRITLDDGSHFDLAAEHELIMRDGTKKRADEVSVGESVMPFYRKVDKNSKKLFDRYEKVFNPNSGKYEFTHRIIAETVEKGNEQYNTVHHKDFNKYNNSPSNLMWMDYHEHHKMHGDLARKIWKDPIKRKSHIENLSKACRGRIMTKEAKEKISKAIKSKYASGEFDFVKEISRKNIIEYNKSEKGIECRRKQGIKLGYREEFKAYNESELHKQHDEIRKVATAKSWEGNGRTNRVQKMNIHFDDFIWDSLRDNILHKKIVNRKTMLEYINDKLIGHLIEINDNKRLENNHFISREVLENRVRERGFGTITEYIKSMLKNHKIAKIETIGGDDVYCMTVVGQNGEEDRHNFAIRSLKADGSLNDSGCFVSNCVDQDIFIPVRDQNAPTPIDTLSAAQNLTAMDDIKFVQDKVCTALRIPKTFLNFEEAQGNGNNLALEDIRFTRTVNRIQQAFLMELTKVASIHLYLLGFTDDLTNFNLTMNNPSTQAEQLEIDNLQKKITAARDAISDPGNGIPIMSQTRALKEIMKWSEKDIKDNLEEIRLEKGIAAELEKTSQIIKRTGLFDTVDRMYGEPGAEYQDDVQQQGDQMGGGGLGGGGGAPMGGGDFGSGLDDLGAPDSDENGDIAGAEGSEPTADMESDTDTGGGDETGGNPMESRIGRKPILAEAKRRMYKKLIKESEQKADQLFSQYLRRLDEANEKKKQETSIEKADIYDKSLMINEEFNKMLNGLDKKLNEDNEKVD